MPSIVQKGADAWNNGDARGMAALFTDDGVYQDFAFGARNQGKANASWVTLTVQKIPGAKAVILDAFQIGDRVAVQWVFSGTPIRLGPVESTGKSFAVPATSIFFSKMAGFRRWPTTTGPIFSGSSACRPTPFPFSSPDSVGRRS